MEPTLNGLGFFCVEGVVWNLHVSPVALIGIFHECLCMKKLHKPQLGRVPTETLPAGLGTGLAFLSLSAGTKHHPGPNVFLACHLGKLNSRMYLFNFCPQIIFSRFPSKRKRVHFFHFSLLSTLPMRPEIRGCALPRETQRVMQ